MGIEDKQPEILFRHVWRTENDGDGDIKCLGLEVWVRAEDWMHDDIIRDGGYWTPVPMMRPRDLPSR